MLKISNNQQGRHIFMYNSIQHFLGFGINKIEKDIKEFLNQGRDFGEFVLKMEENLDILTSQKCQTKVKILPVLGNS